MDSLDEMARQGEFLIGLLTELACWALAPGVESFFTLQVPCVGKDLDALLV
jgi:hypothetical protein